MAHHIEALEHRALFASFGLDPAFGVAGIAQLDAPVPDDYPSDIGIGLALTPSSQSLISVRIDTQFQLFLVDADGSQDQNFGTSGTVPLGAGFDVTPPAMAVDPASGRIAVVHGSKSIQFLTADGKPDPTLGVDGLVTFDFAHSSVTAFSIDRLAFASDGGLILGGSVLADLDSIGATGKSPFVIGRLNPDGSADEHFGDHGLTKEDAYPNDPQRAFSNFRSMQVAPDGLVYVMVDDVEVIDDEEGIVQEAPKIARLAADGKYDKSFSDDGIRRLQSNGFEWDSVGLALTPDGSIVYAIREGNNKGYGRADVVLRRLLSDGSIDPAFPRTALKGFAAIIADSLLPAGENSIAIAPNGDIFTGELAAVPTDDQFSHVQLPGPIEIRRLDSTGHSVTTWGDDGLARSDSVFLDNQTAIAVASDGKVLMAGQMQRNGKNTFAVARFNGSGVQSNDAPGTAKLLSNGSLDIAGTAHADAIHVSMQNGQIRVHLNKSHSSFDPAGVLDIAIHGGAGDDEIFLEGDLPAAYLQGEDGNDTIQGSIAPDNISGGRGDDRIDGGSGDDFVRGYGGRDTLIGSDGNDILFGGGGSDRLLGGNGFDTIQGSTGNDLIKGGADFDSMLGEAGDDTFITRDNDSDYANGGDGNDFAIGDKGDDDNFSEIETIS